MALKALEREYFDAGELMAKCPPRWHDRNKSVVFEIACSSGVPFEGRIVFARWAQEQLPASVMAHCKFSVEPGVYKYAATIEPSTVAWHVNFADPNLFVAYSSSLMAQDELQVAEHPVLGSLRDALASSGHPPTTIDEQGRPTPITISGVQRRCAIDTLPNPQAGRPGGLYGNAFARTSVEQVRAATKPLCPPTITNILAMAASACGYGEYSRQQMVDILNTALTGFSATRRESDDMVGPSAQTLIHTGFWGCGAFGGNRTLMTVLQALAADLAEVDVVFWAFDEEGVKLARDARRLYDRVRDATSSVSEFLDYLVQRKFQWGVSDGN